MGDIDDAMSTAVSLIPLCPTSIVSQAEKISHTLRHVQSRAMDSSMQEAGNHACDYFFHPEHLLRFITLLLLKP